LWERLEVAETGFEVGREDGVGDSGAVDGGELVQNACVLSL